VRLKRKEKLRKKRGKPSKPEATRIMSFEKNLDMPSIKEAVMLADLFDSAGEYETAALLDEFVDNAASSSDDIVKQAGFWANLLKRLKGRSKRIFFSVYRELHDKAKNAQEALDEEVSRINDEFKTIKKHLKLYELVDWRYQAQKLGLANIEEIMSGYDQTYAKLIGFFDIFKKKDEEGEGKPEKELTPIEKLPGVPRGERIPGAEEGWVRLDPRTTSIQKNEKTEDLRIDFNKFQDYLGLHLGMPGKNKVRFVEHKGKLGRLEDLKEFMGTDIWNITGTDDKWVYLSKTAPPKETEVPTEPEEEAPVPEEPTTEEEAAVIEKFVDKFVDEDSKLRMAEEVVNVMEQKNLSAEKAVKIVGDVLGWYDELSELDKASVSPIVKKLMDEGILWTDAVERIKTGKEKAPETVPKPEVAAPSAPETPRKTFMEWYDDLSPEDKKKVTDEYNRLIDEGLSSKQVIEKIQTTMGVPVVEKPEEEVPMEPEEIPAEKSEEVAARNRVWVERPGTKWHNIAASKGAIAYTLLLEPSVKETDRVEEDPKVIEFLNYQARGRNRAALPGNWKDQLIAYRQRARVSRTARMNRIMELHIIS
jgi:hypothetical protein